MWEYLESSWMCEPEDKMHEQNLLETVCQETAGCPPRSIPSLF